MRKLIALLVLFAAPAAFADCAMTRFQRVQASPHVIVYEAAEGSTAVVNGNIIAVIGSEAVLVVDTGQFPSIARRVVADIKATTRAPVRYVVNTHWHGDHLLGNFVFKQAWPEAKFVAHSHTISQAARYYANYLAEAPKSLPIVVDQMKKELAESKSEDRKLWLSRTLECAEAIIGEVGETAYLAPDTPMDSEMKIDLGGVEVVVKSIGTGNTPGDLIVWVPADKLVASGDMVVAPTPYAIGSSLEPWVKTLGNLRALGATTIVPGHGPVMRDDRYVRDLEALFTTTRTQLVALEAQGVARKDAADKLDVGEFRTRYLTTPMRREAFRQFYVMAAIQQIWPKPPPPAPK
jgi:glyoxylase-like metal-dependent hydrolase (beta-lactamase superfamily II)